MACSVVGIDRRFGVVAVGDFTGGGGSLNVSGIAKRFGAVGVTG